MPVCFSMTPRCGPGNWENQLHDHRSPFVACATIESQTRPVGRLLALRTETQSSVCPESIEGIRRNLTGTCRTLRRAQGERTLLFSGNLRLRSKFEEPAGTCQVSFEIYGWTQVTNREQQCPDRPESAFDSLRVVGTGSLVLPGRAGSLRWTLGERESESPFEERAGARAPVRLRRIVSTRSTRTRRPSCVGMTWLR
jgi:hypothetical protein